MDPTLVKSGGHDVTDTAFLSSGNVSEYNRSSTANGRDDSSLPFAFLLGSKKLRNRACCILIYLIVELSQVVTATAVETHTVAGQDKITEHITLAPQSSWIVKVKHNGHDAAGIVEIYNLGRKTKDLWVLYR